MIFDVSCKLHYELNAPTTFLFILKCVQTGGQVIQQEKLTATTEIPLLEFSSGEGMNRYVRVNTQQQPVLDVAYTASVSTTVQLHDYAQIREALASNMDPAVIPYLFPSRYCPSDQFVQEATRLFGNQPNAYAKVQAISDWIHDNVKYQSGTTNNTSNAWDAYNNQAGVCRDFAHLGISFCRALCIPARYLTAYAYQLDPMDFHACFEVYLGNTWYVFDATRLAPLNGLVRIATGRDAADAAVSTIYGQLGGFTLNVDCQAQDPGNFQPITRDSLRDSEQALALM